MGGSGAVLPAAIVRRASAQVADAADRGGNLLPPLWRSALADAAAVLSAGLGSAALVLSLAR